MIFYSILIINTITVFYYYFILLYFVVFCIYLGEILGDKIFLLSLSLIIPIYFNMAIPKYNIKRDITKPSSSGVCSVRLRVSSQSKRVDLHTGITLLPKQWSRDRVKQGCVVNGLEYNVLNDILRKQEEFIANYFNNCALRGDVVNLLDLKKQFNYVFKSNETTQGNEFFYVIEQYISNQSQTRVWRDSYKEEWMRLVKSIRKYNKTTNWSSFTETYMNGYLNHLALTLHNDKIKKYLRKLSEFLKWAKLKRFPVNDDFFVYNPKLNTSKKEVRYLTPDEILELIKLDLSDNPILEQYRDYFIFQCFIGFRFSDLKRLKKNNITQEDDNYYLEVLTKKDTDRIRYKLPNIAVGIYLRYAVNDYDGGVMFPLPSNQKFNDYLKELGSLIDMKGEYVDYKYKLGEIIEERSPRKDIQSHDARRSFIVMAINLGVDAQTVALLTSHSDLRVMQPYIALHNKTKDKVIDAINTAFEERFI